MTRCTAWAFMEMNRPIFLSPERTTQLKQVELYTDGACQGNPRAGRLGRDSALRRA